MPVIVDAKCPFERDVSGHTRQARMLSSVTCMDCYNHRRASRRTHSLTLPSLSMLAYVLMSASRSVRLHTSPVSLRLCSSLQSLKQPVCPQRLSSWAPRTGVGADSRVSKHCGRAPCYFQRKGESAGRRMADIFDRML